MNDDLNKPRTAPKPADPTAGQSSGAPAATGGIQAIVKPIKEFCDPIVKICYKPLASHYEIKYRTKYPVHHSKIFFIDLALMFVVSALAVSWIFAATVLPLIPAPPLAQLEYSGPREIVSGKDDVFTYAYQNLSTTDMVCAELHVRLPAGTVLADDYPVLPAQEQPCVDVAGASAHIESDSAAGQVLVFPIGTIPANGSGAEHFTARTYGPTGDVKSFDADFSYWTRAATAPSSVASREDVPVTSSTLSLGITMPKTIGRGLPHDLTVSYENVGVHTLTGTTIRLLMPADFVLTSTSPAMKTAGEWQLGDLSPGDKGELKAFGYFRTNPDAMTAAPTFSARGYVRDGGAAQFAENVRKNADPRAADLSFTQAVVAPTGRQVLSPGDTVRVAIAYKNSGTTSIQNMEVHLDPGATFIADSSPVGLAWDSTTLPELKDIAPGQSGQIEATFTLKEAIDASDIGATGVPALHIIAHATYSPETDGTQTVRVDTATLTLPVTTGLGIDAAALYYTKDGDQLGVGPLPPTVGQTTKYRIFLTVTSTSGDVTGARVEATLPANVTWTNHSSVTDGSAIDYFPSTHSIRWDVADVPAGSGNADANHVGASFEVAVTPTAKELGSAPQLLSDIKVSGIDADTGATIHATAANISTDLPYDRRAAGKGTVVK